MLPASAATSPESILMRVVLPAPLGRMTPCSSPSLISSDISSTAFNPPKLFDKPRASKTDSAIVDIGFPDVLELGSAARKLDRSRKAVRECKHDEDDQSPHRQLPMFGVRAEKCRSGKNLLEQ